jgi:hypothetical protein
MFRYRIPLENFSAKVLSVPSGETFLLSPGQNQLSENCDIPDLTVKFSSIVHTSNLLLVGTIYLFIVMLFFSFDCLLATITGMIALSLPTSGVLWYADISVMWPS